MSIWNPTDTIRDVAESVGIGALPDELSKSLAMDVEYRISQVLQESLKFMRHSKRTTLTTMDVNYALRILDVEPLYGYESRTPLAFGEATFGPGQPLFYIEDEEVDFEKMINVPLPKVPREVSFSAHWLAVEGVQPQIPQNPSATESRAADIPKGSTTAHSLAAIPNTSDTAVKPLVKHILSKELQIYFERICATLGERDNEGLRNAALASIRHDPGLHQLLPYFVQYIREKITHGLLDLFTLTTMMEITSALLANENLFIDPYISAIVPSILTCLIGKRLGPDTSPSLSSYPLRDMAASLINVVSRRFGESSHTFKPRLARTFLKTFLDNTKPYGTLYGSILGLSAVGGPEVIQVLILPNVKAFIDGSVKRDIAGEGQKKVEAEMCLKAIVTALKKMKGEDLDIAALGVDALDGKSNLVNGDVSGAGEDAMVGVEDEKLKNKLIDRIGDLAAEKVMELGDEKLVRLLVKTPQVVP